MEEEKKDALMQNNGGEDFDSDEDDEEMDDIGELSHATLPPPTSGGAFKAPAASNSGQKTMLGGGQYDPLTWDQFYDSKEMICDGKIPLYIAGSGQGHVFLCLHGAGHSAQSFAVLASILKKTSTCVSFDFRGHGDNTQEDPLVMSVDNLIKDSISVMKEVAAKFPEQSIIIVGHSMGGSIAVKAVNHVQCNLKDEEWSKHIMGLFVIDVVEGSAMEALPFMESIVQKRPAKFQALQNVVQYGYSNQTVRDLTSARVSMPSQVEEKVDAVIKQKYYAWKTDLMATKPYWTTWFEGLTKTFLELSIPKQLLLAGSERMDKDLTIAHMEGKFKMVVVYDVGHAIQEDKPAEVAQVFQDFLTKFHIPEKYAQKLVITSISGKQVSIGK